MKRAATAVLAGLLLLLAACTGSGSSSSSSSSSSTASTSDGLVDIGQGLRGPTGLHASVYATGLSHVAALAFDDQGRLWAATSDSSDQGQDGVYVIASVGATPVKVLNGLHTPLGLLWSGGTLYVSATGAITAYSDFDGSAFATTKAIVSFADGTGEVNGIVLGPDGRLRVGISAPCDHCTPTNPQSGSIISFLPDGSDVQVEVKDVRAPIALVYFAGELFVTMNQRDDLGAATPGDWLSIVQPGQSWGFPDCYGQGGTTCASQPKPVAELDPHSAASGLAFLQGQLGYVSGAVVAEWATAKVLLVTLSGTTATGVSTFISGLTNPVPLLMTNGGQLLIGDWGAGTVYSISGP